jgi:hypothetical protein
MHRLQALFRFVFEVFEIGARRERGRVFRGAI